MVSMEFLGRPDLTTLRRPSPALPPTSDAALMPIGLGGFTTADVSRNLRR